MFIERTNYVYDMWYMEDDKRLSYSVNPNVVSLNSLSVYHKSILVSMCLYSNVDVMMACVVMRLRYWLHILQFIVSFYFSFIRHSNKQCLRWSLLRV